MIEKLVEAKLMKAIPKMENCWLAKTDPSPQGGRRRLTRHVDLAGAPRGGDGGALPVDEGYQRQVDKELSILRRRFRWRPNARVRTIPSVSALTPLSTTSLTSKPISLWRCLVSSFCRVSRGHFTAVDFAQKLCAIVQFNAREQTMSIQT